MPKGAMCTSIERRHRGLFEETALEERRPEVVVAQIRRLGVGEELHLVAAEEHLREVEEQQHRIPKDPLNQRSLMEKLEKVLTG